MRTTIDLPDTLFRKTKATAAARGVSLKTLIAKAVERDITAPPATAAGKRRPRLPVVHLEKGHVLDLSNFNFDDLLT
jgi:hypothetical protein